MTVYISHEGKLELLPEKIRNFIPKWKEAAIAAEACWFEKYARVKFSYEEVNYFLEPNAIGLNGYMFAEAKFESISNIIIEDLKTLGATNLCYLGMPD